MAYGESYEEFVEKFKPKKTTDDCYTPPLVYEAVASWAVKEYGLEGRQIVRPFYPGGDFENFDYPGGCVVIDNPPFSILKKIKEFYIGRGIDFFLFAPAATLFSTTVEGIGYICANCDIVYDNGARIATSFVTNLDKYFIRTAPELVELVDEAIKETAKGKVKQLPKYKYPNNVLCFSTLGGINRVDFTVKREDCCFIRKLDSQKREKPIYGGGYLTNDEAAARLAAARLAAARLAA
ncbi:MAG: hypothetical protein LUI12_10980, partial [Clostridiales bacterium]|nr:hypothetical protein [Clostridiales bacterium]